MCKYAPDVEGVGGGDDEDMNNVVTASTGFHAFPSPAALYHMHLRSLTIGPFVQLWSFHLQALLTAIMRAYYHVNSNIPSADSRG